MSRIVVTGMGIISAIGNNVAENRDSLLKGITGISCLGAFPSKYAGILPCGEIKETTACLQERANTTDRGLTRTTLMAALAFKEAVSDAGLSAEELGSTQTALIGATTVGGMCLTDELYKDAHEPTRGSVYLSTYDCGAAAIYLQEKYKLSGIISTINTACSSSANAILFGARLLQSGKANIAIVGGVDSLSKFTLNGFNALHILSKEICKPFDRDRSGLNLGEGAAFLVLEKAPDNAGKKVYATLNGYGNSNDAYHPSSLSENGEGPYLSMLQALSRAGLTAGDINFVNAHGTGTENNDFSESKAMIRLFDQVPAFCSTKGYTGHTLGAAGALEAVYGALSLFHQEAYPNLHFQMPMVDTGLKPQTSYQKMPIGHLMSNSFGFGGNCTSLVFSKA